MEFLDKIDYIMEQEDKILPKGDTKVNLDYTFDDSLFDKMANFIVNLDPDKLSDEQLGSVINMIDDLQVEAGDIDEGRKLANKSRLAKNQYGKKWYSKNKTRVRRHKEKLKKNLEGRKRDQMRDINGRRGRTASGRKKVRYNRRVRSDR